ncbi:MAG: ATP-binding cassette domain-containing protein [Geodermatophilaceae bacterium]
MSHGERRQLEIALALACEPQLLLLDEPAAGMSSGESERLIELIRALPATVTVLIVEHDLDVVFQLAECDHCPAPRPGAAHRLACRGVAASAAVREAYLGTANREELLRGRKPDAAGGARPARGLQAGHRAAGCRSRPRRGPGPRAARVATGSASRRS